MKQIIKTFNNLIKKTIFKVWNKTNINLKIDNLNIVKNFNKSVEKAIFKVQNKKKTKLPISKFNKYLITFISLLFFYLFYLLIPILYDKNWVQRNIENQLFENFKIHFSLSSEISYRILPSPHYLIKNSKIFKKDNKTVSLADIKALKVFVSQKNFFNKEKVLLKYIKINNADFTVLQNDLKSLKNNTNNKFSNKKIEINNSNIFFKDNLNEIVSIIKISEGILFQDDEYLINLFKLKGEIFNIPFNIDYNRNFDSLEKEEINFAAKTLKVNIFNKSNFEENNINKGKNIISFLNSKINTNYKIENDIVIFNSINSMIKNSKINYDGVMSFSPFDLNLNINLSNYKTFKINPILIDLIKTKLLFNENISINTSITTILNQKKYIFQNAKINFEIINGKINFNKTKLINKKVGSLELIESNLLLENDELILNTYVVIDIKNSDALFSLLQTNKKSKKNIKKILINLDYNFLDNEIEFNNIKIDNKEVSDDLYRIIDGFNDNKFNNWNKSRRLLNALFDAYEG